MHGWTMVVVHGRGAAVEVLRGSAWRDWGKSIVGVGDSGERGSAESLREGRKGLWWLGRHDMTARDKTREAQAAGRTRADKGSAGAAGAGRMRVRWQREREREREEETSSRSPTAAVEQEQEQSDPRRTISFLTPLLHYTQLSLCSPSLPHLIRTANTTPGVLPVHTFVHGICCPRERMRSGLFV